MNCAANQQPFPLTDADLAKAAAGGDAAAFAVLYERFHPPVRSLIFRLTNAQMLDDLAQETFLRVWKRLPELRVGDTVGPWIMRVAVNVAYDHLRARRRELRRGSLQVDGVFGIEATTGDALPQLEARELVVLALATLDFDHRTVLVMRDLEQMSEAETAAALAVPVGTVKSRLFHARSKVRLFLGDIFLRDQGVAGDSL